MYFFLFNFLVVVCFDGVGEVVVVGFKVIKWKKGDKVFIFFNQGYQRGDMDIVVSKIGFGGCFDGILRQYGIFVEIGVVKMFSNLNYVEFVLFVCVGFMSWNVFYGLKLLKKGQWVVIQGIGGVSLFVLQVRIFFLINEI